MSERVNGWTCGAPAQGRRGGVNCVGCAGPGAQGPRRHPALTAASPSLQTSPVQPSGQSQPRRLGRQVPPFLQSAQVKLQSGPKESSRQTGGHSGRGASEPDPWPWTPPSIRPEKGAQGTSSGCEGPTWASGDVGPRWGAGKRPKQRASGPIPGSAPGVLGKLTKQLGLSAPWSSEALMGALPHTQDSRVGGSRA